MEGKPLNLNRQSYHLSSREYGRRNHSARPLALHVVVDFIGDAPSGSGAIQMQCPVVYKGLESLPNIILLRGPVTRKPCSLVRIDTIDQHFLELLELLCHAGTL